MIAAVHETLRTLMMGKGGFDSSEVELLFDPPIKERTNALLRPAISFFLLGMQENTELRQANRQTVRGENGAVHRMPPRRFDLRYLVSAFATESADEQTLLWRTLVILLQHQNLPQEMLPDLLRITDIPIATKILPEGEAGARPLEYWNALGLPPRPGLIYSVTVPVDLEFTLRSPLVLTRTLRVNADPAAERFHIGGVVRAPEGVPISGVRVEVEGRGFTEPIITDSQGRFVLANVQAGKITLLLNRTTEENKRATRVTLQIPADHYEVTLND